MVVADSRTFAGLYEPVEAARIVSTDFRQAIRFHLDSRKVLRWIRAGLADEALAGVPGRELLLTFEDLVSMRVIAALRAAGVSFPKIYSAEDWLRKVTGHSRPFATEQLWTEHDHVFVDFRNHLIAASSSGQMAMEFIREHLLPVHGLTFDERRVASLWEPRSGVVLDPEVQFGQPCVKGTRIPTKALWGMHARGDSVGFIADVYGLKPGEVSTAIAWENELAA